MADIFISYARADRDKIEKLASALESEGWTVWWDRHIDSGAEFSKDIEAALNGAKAVVVAWSKDSNDSRWVKDEATAAAEEGKLLAISLDGEPPPLGFRQYHSIEFAGWGVALGDTAFSDLKRAITNKLGAEAVSKPAEVQPPVTQKPASKRGFMLMSLIAVVAAAAAGIFLLLPDKKESPPETIAATVEMPAVTVPEASIAVLPFEDLSPEGDQAYFSDGVTEEILNVLARVDGLKVASRTSAFQYKGRNDLSLPQIADALGVHYVLEGSVRKAGDVVRVTAQLIKANQDEHLWSKTFDRKLTVDDIFRIQDEIAKSVVSQLGERMALGEADAHKFAAAAGTDNLRAYELYLEGHERFIKRNYENLPGTVEILEEAVRLDPNFARGLQQLAAAYDVLPGWGLAGSEAHGRAVETAKKALAIDPTLAVATAIMKSESAASGKQDWVGEIDALDRAIALDPKESVLWNWRGQNYASLGFFDKAISDFRRALEIDPQNDLSAQWLVNLLLDNGDLEEAWKVFERYDESFPWMRFRFAFEYAHRGDVDRAFALLKEMAVIYDTQGKIDFQLMLAPLIDPDQDMDAAYEAHIRNLVDDAGVEEEEIRKDPLTSYIFKQYDNIHYGFEESSTYEIWMRLHDDFLQSPERYRLIEERELPTYWRAEGFPPQCRAIEPLPNGRDYECE